MYCTIRVAKTKALISFAVTAKLICVFVFAYAKIRFSHDEAQLCALMRLVGWKPVFGISGQIRHKPDLKAPEDSSRSYICKNDFLSMQRKPNAFISFHGRLAFLPIMYKCMFSFHN